MHTNFFKWYREISNTAVAEFAEKTEEIRQSLVSCEHNLWALIQRMADQQFEQQSISIEDADESSQERDSIKISGFSNASAIKELKNSRHEWGYLRQATEKMSSEQKQLLVIDQFKNLVARNPKHAKTPFERAKLRWQNAFEKVRKNLDLQKRQ